MQHIKQEATLTDWAVVVYPDICGILDDPSPAFARYSEEEKYVHIGKVLVLYGRAIGDPRYDRYRDAFADGHRLVTSPIVKIEGDRYYTLHTIYTLKDEDMNEDYRNWLQVTE